MSGQLHPVPHRQSVIDGFGLPSKSWSDWFQKLYSLIGPDGMNNSIASSGYQRLPSGLIIQWGTSASLGSATTTGITFSKVFPNGCFQVILSIKDNPAGSTAATGHFGSGNYSATGFDLYNRTSASYAFNWLAVGN